MFLDRAYSQFNSSLLSWLGRGGLSWLFQARGVEAIDAGPLHKQKHDKCSKSSCHNAADDDSLDSHSAVTASGPAPFDAEDEVGHHLDPAR